MDPDHGTELLRLYVRNGSEAAFRHLVEGYSGLVHGTALRCCHGDHALAQDASQAAFIRLARHASGIRDGVQLAGWLHRTTARAATDLVRSEAARKKRETQFPAMPELQPDAPAWQTLAPLIDTCLLGLSARDREILTLRYLEGCDLRSIGRATGLSEDAAGKRVRKALEKLRGRLARLGWSSSIQSLGAVLAVPRSEPVPAGFAARCSSAAMHASSAGTSGVSFATMSVQSKFIAAAALILLLMASLALPALIAGSSVPELAVTGPHAMESPGKPAPRKNKRVNPAAVLAELRTLTDPESPFFYDKDIIQTTQLLAALSTAQIRQALEEAERSGTATAAGKRYRCALLRAWAKEDPQVAMDHALTLADDRSIYVVHGIWLRTDPKQLLEWLMVDPSRGRQMNLRAEPVVERLLANHEFEPVARYLGRDEEPDEKPLIINRSATLLAKEPLEKLKQSISALPKEPQERANRRLTEYLSHKPQ